MPKKRGWRSQWHVAAIPQSRTIEEMAARLVGKTDAWSSLNEAGNGRKVI